MSTEVSRDDLPTSALFEASHGRYIKLLQGATKSTPAPGEKHVQAAPPQMESYTTRAGIPTEIPVQHPWRED